LIHPKADSDIDAEAITIRSFDILHYPERPASQPVNIHPQSNPVSKPALKIVQAIVFRSRYVNGAAENGGLGMGEGASLVFA